MSAPTAPEPGVDRRVLTVTVSVDEAVVRAARTFDFSFDGTSRFELPSFAAPKRDGSWNIGLLVGPSGSGKSQLLRRDYGVPDEPTWDASRAIISHFGSDGHERLAAVGLSSVPSWCRPFHALSTGEGFRATLARQLAENATVDEFTSVVDRNVAVAASRAVARYIRANRLTGCVFATCHEDVIPWLAPDWCYHTGAAQMLSKESLLPRPAVVLEVGQCDAGWWRYFAPHHYLSARMNATAECFLARWRGTPVAFAAVLPFPNGAFRRARRGHRLVVLPDFQGLGIGPRLSDAIASWYRGRGHRYFSKTAHPRLGAYRDARPALWRPTSKNRRARQDYTSRDSGKERRYRLRHRDRWCWSHEYVGTTPSGVALVASPEPCPQTQLGLPFSDGAA